MALDQDQCLHTQHHGFCLLYVDMEKYGPVSVCGYCLAVPIIFSLIYGGCMIFFSFWSVAGYENELKTPGAVMCFLVTVTLDCCSWLLMLINACLNTSGLNALCTNLFDNNDRCSKGYLYQPVFGRDDGFYIRHKIAEAGSWLSWIVWSLQMGTSLLVVSARHREFAVLTRNRCCEWTNPCNYLCPCWTCRCRVQYGSDDDDDDDKNKKRRNIHPYRKK
ncbi:uncharacterized protein LOC112570013 isoform X2 [Pomacea canaliculata]|uniref:uncharacterized protein LOC112570013 isoform X2 n=1 Tax=Pomacea canaliculata TaxID=400727 RepID=UPI000D73B70F|nr:uncharacterized protein LOC112570013 isoform X2 [Pomacea canaliculata]